LHAHVQVVAVDGIKRLLVSHHSHGPCCRSTHRNVIDALTFAIAHADMHMMKNHVVAYSDWLKALQRTIVDHRVPT
jgi:hypothetical protein